VYVKGAHPSLVPRGLAGLGDAETASECPQPVSTAERDQLRERLGQFAGWGPGTYDQWHEGHPDLIAALDDIGGRMKGLYNRPKLLRCDKDARNRAATWIQQLYELLAKVKSAPNRGWDASGFTRVPATFQWSFYRGPTYTIRSTQDPDTNRAMQVWGAKIWGLPMPADASVPVPPVPPSAPAGSVVINGVAYPSSAAAAAAQVPSAPEAGGVVPTTGGGAAAPGVVIPSGGSVLEGSVAGIPTKYLLYGALGLMAWKMVK